MPPPDSRVGDCEHAFEDAPVHIDARYVTPHHVHMQMEPHTTLALWLDDMLTLYTSINGWKAHAR